MRKLSKSKYCLGLQCPKALWLSIHQPDLAAPVDEATQRIFDMGTLVGKYAQRCFEGGVLIAEDHRHLTEAIASTEKAVAEGAPAIYEATAAVGGALSRADIFAKADDGDDSWDIYEVKSSTELEDQYIDDVSFQRHCFEGAGYAVRDTFLMHINNEYVRRGEIDFHELFTIDDITEEVEERMVGIEKRIKGLLTTINQDACPEVAPGPHCKNPYACGFFDLCNKREDYDIYELPYGGKKIAELEGMGITYLKDVPEGFDLTVRQESVVLANQRQRAVIDREAIREHLGELTYPLYYFDFETVAHAIPFFDESRPYEPIPFQFSLHVQKKRGGEVVHHEFLHNEKSDPRPKLIKEMVKLLSKKGSIVAWHMSFEKTVIANMARDLPEFADDLEAFLPRFWDLIVPFRSGAYAHRDFHGSASLKSVLPVLVPKLSYNELEIQEGTSASLAYERWLMGDLPDNEWPATRTALLKYCHLDTLAMVEILRHLEAKVG